MRSTPETLLRRIDELTAERQQLRSSAVGAGALEQNRLRIAEAQWELSYALIELYLPASKRAA